MTAVRLEQIAVGRSGLGPATAVALVELLNLDRLPTIGRFHSLGTGDVAPLARLALTLPPGALDAGDGLALMSSNALTIGRAALAVIDLDRLLAAATVVTWSPRWTPPGWKTLCCSVMSRRRWSTMAALTRCT